MKATAAFLLLALAAAPARAMDCVAALPPGARLIYEGALPRINAGETMRDALTEVTKGLVYSGRIALWNASPAAHKAADCLDQRAR